MRNDRWECPSCKNGITLCVKVSEPPRCCKHIGGSKEMMLTTPEPQPILSNKESGK